MLFNSPVFLLFLLVILILFYSMPKNNIKKYLLLVASLFFYAYWNWVWVSLLICFILFNYFIGNQINSSKRSSLWLKFGIIGNLSVLFYFKYFQLFTDSIIQFLGILKLNPTPVHFDIFLPIGISFFTFQSIGYLVDISRKDIQPAKSLLDFAIFKSFFPQLIAGPIERAKNILPQLENFSNPSRKVLLEGVYLFAIGLFQKTLIGDPCGRVVDAVFFDVSRYTSFEIFATLLLFTFQIYADFLGYSNMARGIGKFFGIELMKNFNQPYFAINIVDFWKKWHISLSQWLKDYLYIPLGGNKFGSKRTMINVFIVMSLGGLWHGANWNFLVWGIYHALLIILFKRFPIQFSFRFVNQLITFVLVVIGWLFFRVHSFDQFLVILNKCYTFEFGSHAFRFVKMVFGFGLVLFLIDFFEQKYETTFFSVIKNNAFKYGIIATIVLFCFVYVIVKKPLPFVYFQF